MAKKASKAKDLPQVESVYMELPEGEAVFPHLNEPDEFRGSLDFKTGLRVSRDAAASTVRELERIRDEYFAAMPDSYKTGDEPFVTAPVVRNERDDAGELTGNVIFNAKLNAKGLNRQTGETWDQAPKLWDSEGKRVALTDPPVWSKSVLVLRVEARPYAMASTKKVGVSLRLRDVMIVELVTGGSGGGSCPVAPRDGYKRPASEGDDQAGAE